MNHDHYERKGNIVNIPMDRDNTDNRFKGLEASTITDIEKQSVVLLAMNVLSLKHSPGRVLCDPIDTRNYLCLRLANYRNEVFGCIFLDNRHRIIEVRELFQGTIDNTSVHPRVVVQHVLEFNASALILFHNHPSGITELSYADKLITRRLKEALALIDVRVLDHILVAAGESVSFAEHGLL